MKTEVSMKSLQLPSVEELANMRVRDLRKILFKMGVSQAEVSKLIDKNDLVAMTTQYLKNNKIETQEQIVFSSYLWFLAGVTFACLLIFNRSLFSSYFNVIVQNIKVNFKLLKILWKHRLLLSILQVIVIFLLDYTIPYMQLTILLSWVLPHDNILRRFFIPSIPIKINPQTFMSNKFDVSSGYGLDLGPTFTLFALNWIRNTLQKYVSSSLQESIQRRRAERIVFNESFNSEDYDADDQVIQRDSSSLNVQDLRIHDDIKTE